MYVLNSLPSGISSRQNVSVRTDEVGISGLTEYLPSCSNGYVVRTHQTLALFALGVSPYQANPGLTQH